MIRSYPNQIEIMSRSKISVNTFLNADTTLYVINRANSGAIVLHQNILLLQTVVFTHIRRRVYAIIFFTTSYRRKICLKIMLVRTRDVT